MSITRRATAVLALTAGAALGLTACDDGPQPVEEKSGSAQSSTSGSGGTTEVASTMSAEDFSERMTEAQEAAGSVHVEMKIEAAGMSMPMSADMELPKDDDPEQLKMRMIMDMSAVAGTTGEDSPGEMEMIMLGTTQIYMKMGSVTQDKYAKLSEDQLKTMNLDQSLNGTDPAAQAELMDQYLKDFEAKGEETVDDELTTRYDVTVDTEMLTEQAKTQGDDVPEEAAGMLGEELTYKMWVGGDDLPRKISFDMGSAGATEMTFSKWGEDVDISAPPADQVTDSLPGF